MNTCKRKEAKPEETPIEFERNGAVSVTLKRTAEKSHETISTEEFKANYEVVEEKGT